MTRRVVAEHFTRSGKAKVRYQSEITARCEAMRLGKHWYDCEFNGARHWHIGGEKYYAPREIVPPEKSLILFVGKAALEQNIDVYEACRYGWKLPTSKMREVECIIAVRGLLVIGVFARPVWQPATAEFFPTKSPRPSGYVGFTAERGAPFHRSLEWCVLPERLGRPRKSPPFLFTF